LNSVLQAMASLEPVVLYLEHLVRVNRQRAEFRRSAMTMLQQSVDDDNDESSLRPKFGRRSDPKVSDDSTVSESLCESLLDVLHQVNGSIPSSSSSCPRQRRPPVVDPRNVLRAVGRQHPQFRPRGATVNLAEQQDAQELLQAVWDLVAEEGEFQLLPTALPSTFVSTIRNLEEEDPQQHDLNEEVEQLENLNAVVVSSWSGINAKRRQRWQQQQQNPPATTTTTATTAAKPPPTSTTDTNHSLKAEILPGARMNGTTSNNINTDRSSSSQCSPKSILPPRETTDGLSETSSCSSSSSETAPVSSVGATSAGAVMLEAEEKKQEEEHFEVYLPEVDSEEELFRQGECDEMENKQQRLESAVRAVAPATDSPLTFASASGDERTAFVAAEEDISSSVPKNSLKVNDDGMFEHLSKAMQIMMTTISSISPSPLSGWCGSALMCRACRRVRPIHNTLFFDIPVVPTAVSQYVSRRSYHHSPGEPPLKPGARAPPCRLEECLEDFSSIERVHDVECKNCTIQAEIREQESEKEWQEKTIQGLLQSRRAKQRTNQPPTDAATTAAGAMSTKNSAADEFQHLRDELLAIEARLEMLRKIDPDDDEPIPALNHDCLGGGGGSDDAKAPENHIPLKRSDAFKCLLLSRLPSVLSIHVQRRYFDPATGQESKTMQHVVFPEILDVAPYCAYGGAVRPEAPFAGTVNNSSNGDGAGGGLILTAPINYRLMSVVEHRGGAHSGHYVCFRRDPSSSCGTRWLWISDDTVRPCDWDTVRRCQAYMLFYEAI